MLDLSTARAGRIRRQHASRRSSSRRLPVSQHARARQSASGAVEKVDSANARPMTGSAKQSISPRRKYGLLRNDGPGYKRDFATSRRDAPESSMNLSPQGGRGECRVPAAPAASCALCIGRTHTSNNEYTGTPGIPARNGFNGLCRALPGDRALLPPSSAEQGFVTARLGQQTSANLTPASGRQDATIVPSANNISRQRAVDR